ncbi:hypothetical protein BGW36DRAFT_376037 [Talaromyces proteolyticus]|uniref:Amine oxidase domain-containing protein n=1 Tax=Talaromyces proteolyticus TaxID=1131652 RepID=A0AAD4Q176_9EURO|nr:uncharacterized protein BGW36DRAFT_376037 [Talaromyces proteolyticus]KAH8698414.1 hypothetical protein BGW36DRAFT_376037 [Talaromyces proteolyticus]
MLFKPWQLAAVISSAAIATSASSPIEQDFAPEDIISRDVCILGGGGSGTYAAIRLKDSNHSVVVVERNDYLGGHAETFYLDDEKQFINYGVEGVFNDDLSKEYLERLGVSWDSLALSTLIDKYVDFNTGKEVLPPSDLLTTVVGAALYRLAIQKYTTLDQGVYNLPDPVPEELLEPFSKFVEEHALQGVLRLVLMFAQNVGNILDAPLLYIIQNFGVPHINALLEGGYITPKNGIAELYDSAAKVLGNDVLFQTTAIETNRSDSGVSILVENHADGSRKLIKAKKLLITFPPLLESLKGFDLDTKETGLFEKWNWMSYHVAIVNNTGIPSGITVGNADPNNGPASLPHTPFQWELEYLGVPGYLASKIIANSSVTGDDAKNLVISDIKRMGAVGTFDVPADGPNIVQFGSHSPETLIVSTDNIRNGFYKNLYSLQGRHSTFYTGLTFCTDYSSVLWAYTNTVIEKMFS